MGISWESILGDTPALAGGAGGRSSRDCVVDFYCHKAGLVIELDGSIHDDQKEEDAKRDKVLSEMGLRTCAATERSVEALSALGMMMS